MAFQDESLYAVIGIPTIFILGFAGVVLPSILARFFPKYGLTKKYYFSFFNGIACGVLLAVALIHSLSDSVEGFSDVSTLQGSSYTDQYPWAMFVMMMAILILFTVEEILEVLATRFGIVGFDAHGLMQDLSAVDEGHSKKKKKRDVADVNCGHTPADHEANDGECDAQPLEELCDHHHDHDHGDEAKSSSSSDEDVRGPDIEEGKKKTTKTEDEDDSDDEEQVPVASGLQLVLKMIIVFLGLMLHNVFVGLSLGVADNDYVLFIALLFHQFFEGLGMGARVAMAKLKHVWIVLSIDFAFALVPVVFIGIGIGIKNAISSAPDDQDGYNIAKGALQGLSAGVLIYVSIMHMLRAYKDTGVTGVQLDWHRLASWLGLIVGCTILSVIGIWA